MYIQPEMEISKVEPTSIVCDSGGIGETPEKIGGNAPKRRTHAF